MQTELDIHDYQSWYLDNLVLNDGLLTLTLSESGTVAKPQSDPKTFLVVFSDTIQFQVYDETDHVPEFHKDRVKGVVGKYKYSSLLTYLKNETLIMATTPGQLLHYSVMTGNEFIHVLTRTEPKILNVT